PLDEMYAGIIADLTEVYNAGLLPKTNHQGEASLQAVAALLAKVELSAGWDLDVKAEDYVAGTYTVNGREHFSNAASWADKAIGGQALTMSFAEKWSPFNEGNDEVIFSMQWDRAGYPGDPATGGSSMMNQYMSYYGNCVIIGQKGTPSGGKHRQSYKAMRLWGPGDERYDGTFMTEYWNAPLKPDNNAEWGTEGYLAFYNCTREELLKNKNLAFKFYPAYYTEAEVRQDLANNYAKNTQSFSSGYGILNQVAKAVILDYPAVTLIPFNLDGSLGAASQQNTADFIAPAYGGVCVRKYDDPNADNVTRDQTYRDIPMLHLSEMYIVAAEAYYMSDKESEALAKINAVRTRAKADIQQSFDAYKNDVTYLPLVNSGVTFNLTTLDLILDEKARECYAERTRYEDLRRTKQLIRYNLAFSRTIKNANEMKGPDGEYKLLRPIPQEEINDNTALTLADQNPGY
ncbi:MAG: RagB/SusD family nutrient uptake outer membrane protein, partial [Bacteroides sp.]|nr:RagB/SusD family nutrient uptake outer membrane protein [Bacteroides sp.]